jgi:hypothetical protein
LKYRPSRRETRLVGEASPHPVRPPGLGDARIFHKGDDFTPRRVGTEAPQPRNTIPGLAHDPPRIARQIPGYDPIGV